MDKKPPLVLANVLMFAVTAAIAAVLVPWYGLRHGFSAADLAFFAFFAIANGMSVTAGYHRLWAHRTYEAHPALKVFYLIFGTMALQNSVFAWCSGHRSHHLYVDDVDRDPYSARRGFWFSHIGWMLREYPSGREDFSNIPDLKKDPLLVFQHRYYVPLAVTLNFALPIAAGLLFHDLWGMLLLAGVARLVWSHHVTFFINSLAHMWGTRPYTDDNTARDNPAIALVTYGEGYHNFHHIFAHDYRNGVRWWQWDPSKWLINALHWAGLAKNLKRVPWFKIQRAMIDTQFRRAKLELAARGGSPRLDELRRRVAEEYESFCNAVTTWTELREQSVAEAKRALVDRWEKSNLSVRLKALEHGLQLQYRRMQRLGAQVGAAQY